MHPLFDSIKKKLKESGIHVGYNALTRTYNFDDLKISEETINTMLNNMSVRQFIKITTQSDEYDIDEFGNFQFRFDIMAELEKI